MRHQPLLLATPARELSKDNWFARIESIGEEAGYFEWLGQRHAAFFVDQGTTLIVTFESVASIRDGSDDQLPMGLHFARRHGWSHLCLICDGDTWYRDARVYGYFDRLVEDGFFEDFDRVVFYGAGPCGYAAAAYSVTAPGATVIAVQPQATLDPEIAAWDNRFRENRRLSFTDRYGYAPDMIDGAGSVFVLYDPEIREDALHAALFTKPFVTKLRCRHLGENLDMALQRMDLLSRILTRAGTGSFDAAAFWLLFRTRRTFPPYLRELVLNLEAAERPFLTGLACRNVVSRMSGPRFRKKLEEAEAALAREGRTLPAPHRR